MTSFSFNWNANENENTTWFHINQIISHYRVIITWYWEKQDISKILKKRILKTTYLELYVQWPLLTSLTASAWGSAWSKQLFWPWPLAVLWVQYLRVILGLTQIFSVMAFAKDPSASCEGHIRVLRPPRGGGRPTDDNPGMGLGFLVLL